MIFIEIIDLRSEESSPQLDTILLADLKNKFIKYEQKLFQGLNLKDFKICEHHLTNFCFDLLDLDENDQVYIARIFFSSIVTSIMKKHALKSQLHPKVLSHVFQVINIIDSLENISEYLLYIPKFIESIKLNIIGSNTLIDSNNHVELILNLINNHLEDANLSVEWLSQQVKLSTTHINNLFKDHLEQTVGDYITECRINEIAYELMTTSKPMEDIYRKYGFVNQSHFIQRFKRVKGMTPLQYRKQFFK